MRRAAALALIASAAVTLAAHQTTTGKRKLGPEVNSELREVLPMISADGNTLYFVREDQGQVLAAKLTTQAQAQVDAIEKTLSTMTDPAARKQLEDMIAGIRRGLQAPPRTGNSAGGGLAHQSIWFSERQSNGQWGAARRMPAPLADDVATIWVGSVLPDNNTMLVAGDGSPVGGLRQRWQRAANAPTPASPAPRGLFGAFAGTKDLFAWSTRTATGWSQPELLTFRSFSNTSDRLEIFLAPDGRHTLFSILNAESLGKRDLYVSTLANDGVWGTPANLGRVVNSASVELSPFMAADGRTLYFASDRAGGQGGFDLWLTRRLDDSWTSWSTPENLGAEVNTAGNDVNIAVDATGMLAFMSIGPLMKEDIYEFELPAAKRPRPTAFVFGRVTDPSGAPLPAGIVYEFLKTGQGAGRANAKPGDGRYQIALPIGEDFAFRASASGYIAISDRIDLTAARGGDRFERNLVLVPLEVGKPIRLNNVFFDTAQTTLLPESTQELDRLVALLSGMPTMRIEIRGHTDSVDDDAANQRLSDGRAAAVKAYLVSRGIAPSRLQSRGFGETAPLGSNATDEGRRLNRRVEFVILSK